MPTVLLLGNPDTNIVCVKGKSNLAQLARLLNVDGPGFGQGGVGLGGSK